MFMSTGTRKANERDRTCPIAERVHKSNTQKYTIFFDTQVMMQGSRVLSDSRWQVSKDGVGATASAGSGEYDSNDCVSCLGLIVFYKYICAM